MTSLITTKKQPKKQVRNLIGRYIYFTMAKKQLEASTITDLTPNKNYKVIGFSGLAGDTLHIKDDNGHTIPVYVRSGSGSGSSSAHLDNITGWHIRHPNAGEPSNG